MLYYIVMLYLVTPPTPSYSCCTPVEEMQRDYNSPLLLKVLYTHRGNEIFQVVDRSIS